MPHGRPPMSTTTRLYGHFAYSTVQRPMPVPALMNALLERRGVDAIYVPLQVAPEHLAAVIASMRHLRDFAGFCVTMPHKAAGSLARLLMGSGWSTPSRHIGPWMRPRGCCWSGLGVWDRPLPWPLP